LRKIFRQVYELIDDGADLRRLRRHFQAKTGSGRTLREALDHLKKSLAFDGNAFDEGTLVVGMDEVGRGPLAGPLVAACVIIPSPPSLPFLRDSKKLEPQEREALAPRIKRACSHLGYGVVEPEEFGGPVNLHHLTFLAMSRALQEAGLPASGCALLVDGKFSVPAWPGPQRAVIKGDDTSFRIAAASVLAKVYRDKIMTQACPSYPVYGFSKNVGYGTPEHRQALIEHGICPMHRKNFVQRVLAEAEPAPQQCLLFQEV
jgi:ribonuclease HII